MKLNKLKNFAGLLIVGLLLIGGYSHRDAIASGIRDLTGVNAKRNASFSGTVTAHTLSITNTVTVPALSIDSAELAAGAVTTAKLDSEALNDITKQGGFSKLGVGTASPLGKLDVYAGNPGGSVVPNSAADDLVIQVGEAGGMSIITPDANYSQIAMGGPTDEESAYWNMSNSSKIMNFGTAIANGVVRFLSGNGTIAMTIDASQNVGIGTASPGHDLEVSDSNAASVITISTYDDGNTFSEIRLTNSDSDTTGTQLQTGATDVLGKIQFQNVNAANAVRTGATITATQTAGCGTLCASNLVLETESGSGPNTNQLALASDGYVGIGTGSPVSNLHIDGGAVTSAKITFGNTTSAACMMFRDTDQAGWTEVGYLNGAIAYTTVDADGLCDGA